MRKITVNKFIKKDSRVLIHKEDNYYYLVINGHFIIKFDTFDFFTKSSQKKIKKNMLEDDVHYNLYHDILKKHQDSSIKYTNFIKESSTDKYNIFQIGDIYKYINHDFINLLSDPLIDYKIYSTKSKTSPIIFNHESEKIDFIIVPAMLKDENFNYELKEK